MSKNEEAALKGVEAIERIQDALIGQPFTDTDLVFACSSLAGMAARRLSKEDPAILAHNLGLAINQLCKSAQDKQ